MQYYALSNPKESKLYLSMWQNTIYLDLSPEQYKKVYELNKISSFLK